MLLNTRYQIPILKLCDFGYSKSMSTGSVPKTRVGTAAYISPEVARCHGDVAYDTERADVWSCGVTLYCMLAGRYPFMDADQQVRWGRGRVGRGTAVVVVVVVVWEGRCSK